MIGALGRYGACDGYSLTETNYFSCDSLGFGGIVQFKRSRLDSGADMTGKKVVHRSFD